MKVISFSIGLIIGVVICFGIIKAQPKTKAEIVQKQLEEAQEYGRIMTELVKQSAWEKAQMRLAVRDKMEDGR